MRSLAPARASIPVASKTSRSPPTRARSGGLHRLPGQVAPLPAATRQRLEQGLGQPLNGVQVDQSPAAAQRVASYPARALTYGNTIYLGAGESSDDIQLMGHEAAHVLQQRAGASLPQAAGSADGGVLEHEASAAGQALASGQTFNVTGRAVAAPQAETQPKSRWERFKDTVGEALAFTEDLAWSLLEKFSPELVPIVRKGPEGVLDWMKERATGAFEAVVDKVMAPVRAISGVSGQLSAQFGPWLAWVRDAAVKISQNDCSPLREAADKIEAVASKVIGYVVDKLQPLFTKVKEWSTALWDKIGAPIWGWIKDYAAWHWNMLKKLGNWVWDNTAWIRGKAAQVWTWIKNKLGIGDGPEGQNGILQWVQAKLEAAWSKIKTRLAPYQAQILAVAKVVGVVALALSPAGPIAAAGAAVYGVVQAVRWIKANWRGNLVVQARAWLQQTLIPALLGAAKKLGHAVNGVAKQISDGVGRFANSVGSLVGLAAGSALAFLVKGAQWLAAQINNLALWASARLLGLANWLEQALNSLHSGFEKFLVFLKRVGNIILDVYSLPLLLAEKVWNWVPACIREPFVDFLIPLILKQIELFRELVADQPAWQRTKAEVMRLVRLVFKDRDLKGAVRAAFEFVLRVFNIPIEFLVRIKNKALAAWDTVSKKPLAFIKNAVRSMGNGFARFKNNIRKHLLFGVEGWLLGEVADKGISMPESWSDPKAVFGFVMDVLGLSMDHMFELLKKRFSEDKVNKAKKAYGYIKRAWNWVTSLIDTSKSPAENTKALVERARDFAKTVFTGVVEWIIGRVGTELAVLAAAAAASAGLSEVVDIVRRIYKVMLTAQRWMRKILDMVDQALGQVLDIAAGAFDTVGEAFEAILHKGMPVVMGFLADQFGLSGVGTALRDIIDGLRAKVDEAILWLIDKVKALIEAAINFLKGGETPQQRLDNAMETAQSAVNALSGSSVGRAVLTPLLAGIKLRYGLKRLDATVENNLWMLEGEINPVKKVPTAKTEVGTGVGVTEPTSVEYGSMKTLSDSTTKTRLEVGTRMTATVLGEDYFSNGSPTNDGVRGNLRDQIGAARQNKYRIGHLLNHHLGGKGTDWHNLTPLSSSGNVTHLHSIEKAVKNHVTGKQQAFYEVRVNYSGGPSGLPATAHPLEKQFASELQARWCELIPDPKKPGKLMKKDPSPSWIPIPNSF